MQDMLLTAGLVTPDTRHTIMHHDRLYVPQPWRDERTVNMHMVAPHLSMICRDRHILWGLPSLVEAKACARQRLCQVEGTHGEAAPGGQVQGCVPNIVRDLNCDLWPGKQDVHAVLEAICGSEVQACPPCVTRMQHLSGAIAVQQQASCRKSTQPPEPCKAAKGRGHLPSSTRGTLTGERSHSLRQLASSHMVLSTLGLTDSFEAVPNIKSPVAVVTASLPFQLQQHFIRRSAQGIRHSEH